MCSVTVPDQGPKRLGGDLILPGPIFGDAEGQPEPVDLGRVFPELHSRPGEGEGRVAIRRVLGRTDAANLGRAFRNKGDPGAAGVFACLPAGGGQFGVAMEPGLEGGGLEQEHAVPRVAFPRGRQVRDRFERAAFGDEGLTSVLPFPGLRQGEKIGEGWTNGSSGKPASAISARKSARPRSGSRSRSVATCGRMRAESPSIDLRRYPTAHAWSFSRSSGEL